MTGNLFVICASLVGILLLTVECGAHKVYTREETAGDVPQLTNRFAVHIPPHIDPNHVAWRYGYNNLGQIGLLGGYYLFEKAAHAERTDEEHHRVLRGAEEVYWFEQQIARVRYKRSITPTDPLFSHQWHLHNPVTGIDINVLPAWQRGLYGDHVVIAIVDDGLQINNSDLIGNVNTTGSFDVNYNDSDPTPVDADSHGTSSAGVAAARDNSVCGVGAAFRAQISGVRLLARSTTDAEEARALHYASDVNAIYSNSWGPNDDGQTVEGPGRLTRAAMLHSVNEGRGGRGCILVFAAGNGRSNGDNCNYDGYANNRLTIAVGAVDEYGKQAWYSEPCAALLVVAPSSGSGNGQMSHIVTTDLQHGSAAACNQYFGGTSAASPLVAGVIALMLQARPELTWRDVQAVLALTARRVDEYDSDWKRNGAGLWANHKYGFGLVDADAATKMAATWSGMGAYLNATAFSSGGSKQIPDNTGTALDSVITLTDSGIREIEAVEAVVTIKHASRGQLGIALISPSGMKSVLAEPRADHHQDYTEWTFVSMFCMGEQADGDWTLSVFDNHKGTVGSLEKWELRVYGHAESVISEHVHKTR